MELVMHETNRSAPAIEKTGFARARDEDRREQALVAAGGLGGEDHPVRACGPSVFMSMGLSALLSQGWRWAGGPRGRRMRNPHWHLWRCFPIHQ